MHRDPLRPRLETVSLAERLPRQRPFTTCEAVERGVSLRHLRQLVAAGALAHPLRGVYYSTDVSDTLAVRVEVLRLVVPDHCVVTDRSAAWLWGASRVLAPGAHLEVPPVSIFCPPGNRLRTKLTDSGERTLREEDVATLEGLRVTTPLRTACDTGRLLHRDQAIGVMDALTGLNLFDPGQLVVEAARFKGFRGVIQLRCLAPLVDGDSGSPGESVLRLRWLDAPLPRPQCQVWAPAPYGGSYFIDIGLPDRLFGAEYFGEEFHGNDERAHDESRLNWLREHEGWTLVVARKQHVHGTDPDVTGRLVAAARQCGLIR